MPPQWAVSRILFLRLARLTASSLRMTIIPLAPPLLAGSSGLPGSLGRAVRWTPCNQSARASLFGLAPCGVLPATRVATSAVRSYRTFSPLPGRPCDLPSAVCFLCHFPSSCPDRVLPGALPCGVRTFLPPSLATRATVGDRLAHCGGYLPAFGFRIPHPAFRIPDRQPSFSCEIPYCSSFL